MTLNLLRAGDRDWSSAPSGASRGGQRPAAYPWTALGYSLVMVLFLIVVYLWSGTDYVGPDNDDVMRLVQVRDLLDGQAFQDMTQYRLGLAGGTLMHWSRFIDAPIAFLIGLFRLFASPERAEALALAVWPLMLAATIVWLMGLAALKAGGRIAMHVGSCMTIFYVYGMGRFSIGSIDHHNAQLTLAALILVMLVDPFARSRSFAIAGVAAGLSLAIGAETVPFVAGVCFVVAAKWGWFGRSFQDKASAFALALVLTVTAAFFITTPPHLYGMVTCDNLSLGFYSLTTVGGFLLFLLSMLGSVMKLGRGLRFAGLVIIGLAVLATAKVIAPQCLGNPLAGLDPMLQTLWLAKVTEARSILAEFRADSWLACGFYAVGFLAIVACLWRIVRRDRVELHLTLLTLSAIAFLVALVQVRGSMFSNLIAVLPMALVVTDIRSWQHQNPNHAGRALVYVGSVLVSLPFIWSLTGLMLAKGAAGLKQQFSAAYGAQGLACASPDVLAPLGTEPAGVVMAPSDVGVSILRYTPHRVLSAPYHRNQGGMLTELNAGLSVPSETIAFLRGAGVNYVMFCPSETQTRDLAKMKPDGFYAALMRGAVPDYLTLIAGKQGDVQIFRVKLD